MATRSLYLFRPILWSTLVVGVLFSQNFGLAEESTPKADAQIQKIGKFLALTVATEATSGFKRLQRSTLINSIPLKVLGMGEKWEGGDVEKYPGGGHKVNILKPELEKYKDDPEMIILFTDAYDVVMVAGVDRIVEEFKKFDARVVFSAEGFCWPNAELASQYPPIERGKRYLNSGGFIGYASELYKIVTSSPIADKDDDQLFYTKVFLDEKLRNEFSIKLDHRSSIFQNLNGASGDVDVRFKGKEAYVQNTAYNTVPLILHGNGPSKLLLNTLSNYVPNGWNSEDGCVSCWENMNNLEKLEEKDFPTVLLGIFVEQATPFLEEFFNRTLNLAYPKQKIDLFIHNAAAYHTKLVDAFIEKEGSAYKSVKLIRDTDNIKEWHARNLGIDECIKKKCDYYFNLDAVAHIDNPHTLKLLIEQNRPMVAPMMIRPYKAWSNFWGALTNDGFYARSLDYMEIVQNTRRGLWNVPYVTSSYLIQGSVIHDAKTKPSYINNLLDADMALCTNMREKGIDMYVTNRLDWGHLINAENFDTSHLNNEMYEIFNNRWDWEQRYIHENYSQSLDESLNVTQPCPDVYWFPVFKIRFCTELVQEMENFGKWSDGTNSDPRLDGGYENVPTRDIHMRQIGYEPHWLQFLQDYVRPLQERVFKGYFHDDPRIEGGYESVPTRDIHMKQIGFEEGWLYFLQNYVQPLQQRVFQGYYNDPPRAIMNFVVRYRPDEQPFLRPHHDSSTYTINVALNRGGIDYQGGGCRFLRYNCSVTDTKQGWMLMHPGRLTHYHEGLYVTEGTRYIMVSFVDP